MKQVKFKAIEVVTGMELQFPAYFDIDNDGELYRTAMDEGREVVAVQYTGLKDIKGTGIYEGDIVAYDTEEGVYCAAVAWTDDVDPNRDMSPILGPGFILERASFLRTYHEDEDAIELLVIGNIYANAELVKDGDER